jgi:tRNA(Ile)-lysidine synthase
VNLIEKVKQAIERENLIPEGARVIVGVSGGADSVALLHILCRFGYDVTAAHLNHSIRGAQADADEALVKNLCAKLDVDCVTHKTDVPVLAKEKGISLEMAAREARHEFFRSVISDLCPLTSVVCLAHHVDDQLETFFLRAARGSGPAGLGGMKPFQCLEKLTLIRPMLGIRKHEILQWLETEGLEWREDESNADESIPRNLVRHQILPILGKINECAAENILRTMEILRDEESLWGQSLNSDILKNVRIQGLTPVAVARREARDQLIKFGVSPTFDAIEQFIEFSKKKNGTQFLDLEGVRLVNEYGALNVAYGRSGILPLNRGWKPLPHNKTIRTEESIGILRGKWEASVSLSKVDGREVTVRVAEPGDRMNPYGMEGSKKLQDIFTDLKIPKAQRTTWPVVECGDEIIWLPGYRIARGWELSGDAEPALHLFCESES